MINLPLRLTIRLGFTFAINLLVCFLAAGQTVTTETSYLIEDNLFYYEGAPENLDEYIQERCFLNLYYPEVDAGFPTIVWFHGGGLTAGEATFPAELKEQGVAIATVNYRLYPRAKAPAYIEDAAAAVAWVFKHIAEFGGDPDRVYVSGHSAGGYLASMVGLDKRWLKTHGVDADQIAGLIPFSGHTITHFTVRDERGIPGTQPIIDDLAPLFHVRPDAPPLLLITGDREKELLGRYEENAFMMRMMKVAGHEQTTLLELDGYNHGGMARPAFPLLLDFIKAVEIP